MSDLVVAPVVVALLAALATLAAGRRPRLQRAVSVAGGVAYAGVVALLVWRVVLGPAAPGAAAYQVGTWPAPYGITLVLDGLSAFFLAIAAAVGVAAIAFAVAFVDRANQQVYFHPLFHLLFAGVSGALLTGDLFNLFVWFEVMLLSSYVFVAFYGGARHTAGAFRYLVVNVVGSAAMLLGIGGLYALTGTLNLADLSRRLANPAAYGIDVAPVVGVSAFLVVTFALKAGLVPFQFWVPAAYTAAPLPVTAVFAGVTKKVGLYAIVRLSFAVLAGTPVAVSLPGLEGGSPLAVLAPVLAAMGIGSVLVGGLGAVGRDTIEGTLAYSSVGQVGFVAVPIAVAAGTTGPLRRVALIAAFAYALHHSLAKGLLFLAAAAVRDATGTNELARLGGLGARSPVLAGCLGVGLASLIGIPPLLGFFGKFLVFDVAVRRVAGAAAAGSTGALLAAAAVLVALLAGAVLTILYATRTWLAAVWGASTPAVDGSTFDGRQLAVLAGLATLVAAVGVGFEPVYRFAETAADAALDAEGYVEVVDPLDPGEAGEEGGGETGGSHAVEARGQHGGESA